MGVPRLWVSKAGNLGLHQQKVGGERPLIEDREQ